MKDAIINVLLKGILDSVSLHSHEETTIDGEQPGPSGINPLSTPEPLSSTNTDSTAPVPEKRKRKQTISNVNGKGKQKGKGKRKKKTTDDNDENCAICNKAYTCMDGEDWICCNLCSLWHHRQCANLEDESEWCRLSGDEPFICTMCQ